MKRYETTTETRVHVTDRLVEFRCDLCGAKLSERPVGEFTDCEISMSKGVRWDDFYDYESTFVDLCGDCFESKLIPWLKSQGMGEPRTRRFEG